MKDDYELNQFPKNKKIDSSNLNEYQEVIRSNLKKNVYGKTITCNKCFIEQPIKEFYVKNKDTGRRQLYCRDCQMKGSGVVEIGKQRFADAIENKGFRRCSICKETKMLSSFKKNKRQKNGISNNCYDCGQTKVKQFKKKQKNDIGDFYVKQYCLRNYGFSPKNREELEKYREEISEGRKPKYFIDDKQFTSLVDFSIYIEKTYGNPQTMTKQRIHQGKTEEDCKLSEFEMRSKQGSVGKIRVTDTITNQVFYFKNTLDVFLVKMFSKSTITSCIKSGKKTRITKLSKYKNPCIIERIK
jgi:hypothetical protein